MPFSEAIMDRQTWDDAAYSGLDKLSFGMLPAFMDWSNRTAGIPESEKPGREQMRRDIATRSPTASKIGGAVGTIAPLIATGGGSGLVRGALTAGGQNVIDQTSRNVLDDRPVDPTEALMSTASAAPAARSRMAWCRREPPPAPPPPTCCRGWCHPACSTCCRRRCAGLCRAVNWPPPTVGQIEKAVSPLIAGTYGGLEKPNDFLTEEEREALRRRH